MLKLNDIEIGKSIGMYEVHPETVGLFTGLCDKNEKEIKTEKEEQ